jgi:hypothetical protein
MWKIIFAAALIPISLCSCVARHDRDIQRNMVGATVVGDDQYATVAHVRNEKDGQRLADKHCGRFGKSARFDKMEGTRAIYNCQSPSL